MRLLHLTAACLCYGLDLGGLWPKPLPPYSPSAATFKVAFETTAGGFTVDLDRELSPEGVDRFLALASEGFFDDQILYRVVPGFLVQFGVAADAAVQARWQTARIGDEPNRVPFRAGTLSYAGAGEDSRSCHFFIALEPHGLNLGKALHETTLGWVVPDEVSTLETVVRNFEASGYPDTGKLQGELVARGNGAAAEFPLLDRITRCYVCPPE